MFSRYLQECGATLREMNLETQLEFLPVFSTHGQTLDPTGLALVRISKRMEIYIHIYLHFP